MFLCNLRPVKQLSSEVVVGAQCGSAVLRGAHVFHPGIIASPKCETSAFVHILLYHLKEFVYIIWRLFSSPHAVMKVGDVVSVFSDLEGRCTRGAFSFQGNKVFVGNGVAEMDRSRIFSTDEPVR